MVISESKRFVFFHIHKTGGTSVDYSLFKFFDYATVLEQKLKALGMQLEPYETARDLVLERTGFYLDQQYFLGQILSGEMKGVVTDCLSFDQVSHIDPSVADKVKDYFCFTFVRNPYDRIYSAFQMHERDQQRRGNVSPNPFEKQIFVNAGIRGSASYLPSLEHVNYIGRTECLAEHFSLVCKKLKLETDLYSVNIWSKVTTGYRYLHKHTPETIEFVNRTFQEDFELFQYPMLSPDSFANHINDSLVAPPIERRE